MKIDYTLQKDFGKYGARWGCYATAILNICENEIGRRLTELELCTVIGAWFKTQSVYIANYHNHKAPIDRGNNWDSFNDPEWHFLVGNPNNALFEVFYSISKKLTTKKAIYKIVLFDVYDGHYCLNIDGKIINPDPSINISNAKITKEIDMNV